MLIQNDIYCDIVAILCLLSIFRKITRVWHHILNHVLALAFKVLKFLDVRLKHNLHKIDRLYWVIDFDKIVLQWYRFKTDSRKLYLYLDSLFHLHKDQVDEALMVKTTSILFTQLIKLKLKNLDKISLICIEDPIKKPAFPLHVRYVNAVLCKKHLNSGLRQK